MKTDNTAQKGHIVVLVIAGIAALLLIVGMALYLYKNLARPAKSTETVEEIKPVVTFPNTSNWKTYASQLGYSFKYPNEATLILPKVVESPDKAYVVTVEYQDQNRKTSKITKETLADGYMAQVTLLNMQSKSLKEMAEISRGVNKLLCPRASEIAKTTLSGHEALTYNTGTCSVDIGRFAYYYVQGSQGGLEVALSYRSKDQALEETYRSMVEGILSTFVFK